jgi:hypothetical protein
MSENEEADTSLDGLIGQLGGCSAAYWKMDVCLDTEKKWEMCQESVRELKACWEKLEASGSRDKQKEREMMYKLRQYKLKNKKPEI